MYVSAREELHTRDERGGGGGGRRRAARRVEGSLPKQASVVELNKRRSYQFIMGRHVAHARAYRVPPFLSRYITACTRVALENRCTLTIPPHRQRPPPGLPHPPLAPSRYLYAAVYLARSITTSPLHLSLLPLSVAAALCLSSSLCGSPVRRDKLNFRSWRVPVGSANREGQRESAREREKERGGGEAQRRTSR